MVTASGGDTLPLGLHHRQPLHVVLVGLGAVLLPPRNPLGHGLALLRGVAVAAEQLQVLDVILSAPGRRLDVVDVEQLESRRVATSDAYALLHPVDSVLVRAVVRQVRAVVADGRFV